MYNTVNIKPNTTSLSHLPGMKRSGFENKVVTFEEHIQMEHNMWHYLYFVVHLRIKDKTEFTGPESYVYSCIKDHIESKVGVTR